MRFTFEDEQLSESINILSAICFFRDKRGGAALDGVKNIPLCWDSAIDFVDEMISGSGDLVKWLPASSPPGFDSLEKIMICDSAITEYFRLCELLEKKGNISREDCSYRKNAYRTVEAYFGDVYSDGFLELKIVPSTRHKYASHVDFLFDEYFSPNFELVEALINTVDYFRESVPVLKRLTESMEISAPEEREAA